MLDNLSACFEGIANRGSYLALTARRKMPVVDDRRDRAKDNGPQSFRSKDIEDSDRKFGADTNTTCPICSRELSKIAPDSKDLPIISDSDEDIETIDSSSSSLPSDESEEWNSAEESWSEGSTVPTENDRAPWNTLESSENDSEADARSSKSESESESSEDETASNAPAHSYGQLKEESESDGGDIEFDCGSDDDAYEGDSDYSESDSLTFDSDDNDDDDDDDDDDEPWRRSYIRHKPKSKGDNHAPKGLLTIYDVGSENPVQLFKFSHPLPIMLYNSPPVFHPTKPLVVWPLCGGEILFADFEGKTYFIRKARPSTTRSMSPRLS